jgi:hypothetical protein
LSTPERLLRSDHGRGGVLRNDLGQRLGFVEEILRRVDDLADHAQLVGPLGAHALVLAGERHAHHGLERHAPNQADGLVGHHLPDGGVRIHERRGARCDHDVGVRHVVQAPAGADSVDGTDHRLLDAAVPGGEAQVEVLELLRVALHALLVGGDLLHVGAGVEGPSHAAVDDDAHLGVAVELSPGFARLFHQLAAHGVQGVGAVEDQPADVTPLLDDDGLVAHCALALSCSSFAPGPTTHRCIAVRQHRVQ